jgi:hypothetical protein
MRKALAFSSFFLFGVVLACSSSPQGTSSQMCYTASGDKAPPCVAKDDSRLKGWLGSGQVWCVTSVDDGPTENQPGPGQPGAPVCCYQVHSYSGGC